MKNHNIKRRKFIFIFSVFLAVFFSISWFQVKQDKNKKVKTEINKKKTEVTRQIEAYRGNTNYNFDDKTIILVDDGIATGSTVCAILEWLLQKQVKEIILATPVIPLVTQEIIKRFGIQIIALETPMEFSSVGQFYRSFDQIPDQVVISILEKYKSK